MWKKIVGLVVVAVGLTCFAACGSDSESNEIDTEPYEASVLSEINGDNIKVDVPENILDEDGPLAKEENINQKSEDGSTEITITGEKDSSGTLEAYVWSIQINNESAGNEFEYIFSNMENREVLKSEDVSGSEFDGGICIVDKEGGFISEEISEPTAHDANGNPVKSYYRIEGNSLIQGVELTDDTAYPVTIE